MNCLEDTCSHYIYEKKRKNRDRSIYLMYIVCISNCCHLHIFELRALCKLIIDKTIFFLSGFSFTDSDNSQDSRGKEGTIFYSTLPVPLVHEHWDIYLQLCMWDDCHIFSIALLVFTRLLLDEIYHLIKLPFDWLMMECQFCLFTWWFDSRFCWNNLAREIGEYKLASTITLVLQANPRTKCASHPFGNTVLVLGVWNSYTFYTHPNFNLCYTHPNFDRCTSSLHQLTPHLSEFEASVFLILPFLCYLGICFSLVSYSSRVAIALLDKLLE